MKSAFLKSPVHVLTSMTSSASLIRLRTATNGGRANVGASGAFDTESLTWWFPRVDAANENCRLISCSEVIRKREDLRFYDSTNTLHNARSDTSYETLDALRAERR